MSVGMTPKEDQRVFDRFAARFPAKFKDAREDFGAKVILRDASAEGARIATRDRLFINDKITLEVELPDGKDPMTVKGQVVWSKQRDHNLWDCGLKFHKISLMKMSRLYSLVAEHI